ncbi:uncharacterized protein DDB_G0283697-like [Ochlerotatus camptorhynchus]|uniref:uncharacterized protein DDB_G0283697-like n=1 Tax=Ochlerotatus camptorhynchus TaxID=644619 RepID=UPI0031D053D5
MWFHCIGGPSLSSKTRKDTGYSTASSQTTAEQKHLRKKAGKRATAASGLEDEVTVEMGLKQSGKKGKPRKLMTSQDYEVDDDGLEEVADERKRPRNRKDSSRSGNRKQHHRNADVGHRRSGGKNRKHGKKLAEDNVLSNDSMEEDHDDDDHDNNDGTVDKANGRQQDHDGSDVNDSSEFEIIHEKSGGGGGRDKRSKKRHRRTASSAASTSGSSE